MRIAKIAPPRVEVLPERYGGIEWIADFDFSYGVFTDGARVICSAEGRIGYREWARNNGR